MQRKHRRMGDRRRVDLEERAQLGPRVAAPEAVGAEHDVAPLARHERADRLRHRAHPVADRHHRRVRAGEHAFDVRHAARALEPRRALAGRAVSGELAPTGGAHHLGGHAVLGGEQIGRSVRLGEQRPAADQRDPRRVRGHSGGRRPRAIQAAQEVRLDPGGQRGLGLVLVADGDVVEDVALLLEHLAHAVLDDHRELARAGRIPCAAVRHGGRDQVRAAILVLQALAAQRRAAGGRADQEAAGTLVGRRPDLVADPLEAEHRVVDVERHHREAVHRVGGCGRGPRGECTRFGDALLEDLPVGRLAVVQHRADVLGLVALADRRPDAHLAKEVRHPEGARLVGDDRRDAGAERRVLEQVAEHPHEGHGGRHLAAFGIQRELAPSGQRRHRHRLAGRHAHGHRAAECLAALA